MVSATYSRNYERNGIEIKFSEMPSESIREELLRNKWRYSRYSKIWYIFYSESNLSFAKEICGRVNGTVKQKNLKAPNTSYALNSTFWGSSATLPSSYSYMNYKAPDVDMETKDWYGKAQMEPKGHYKPISPNDVRYKRKRSFFS